ncbi:MAG TPA: hypothetical protein VIM19_03070 [Actinomycetes bacterium]
MKRLIPAFAVLLLVGLAGCSSTSNTVASSVSPTTTGATTSPAETTSPSGTPSSSTVAGGTATDYCGAFKEIQAVNDTPSSDPATAGAKMQKAAADMRKYAPTEITKAANTYANVMDNIGKAAASGSFDQAALAKAISDGMAGNAKDIATVAVWVAKNCKL